MTQATDEFVAFVDEPDSDPTAIAREVTLQTGEGQQPVWRVLIVDDDEDVHQATEFSLAGLRFLNRHLEFLHARSSLEAIDLLMNEKHIAVILLDVVMEHADAGLSAVSIIRRDLELANVQIILRTGQPGYAPEIETIRRYDINDYRTKSELTRTKLYTAMTSAIRAYDHLCRLDAARKGLEQVVLAGSELIVESDRHRFDHGVLRRAATLMGVPDNGFVIRPVTADANACRIVAATGRFVANLDKTLAELEDPAARATLSAAIRSKRNQIDAQGVSLCFRGTGRAEFAAYLPLDERGIAAERQLIDVFCNLVATCGENLDLVDELTRYAFIDAQTGLRSRRAFIGAIDERLAAPGANRANIAVALVDIDQFAEINDAFGHQYGDQLLRAMADRLSTDLDQDCLLARIGVDIFGVLGTPAQVRPESLRPLFQAPFQINDDERPVSASMSFVIAAETEGSGIDLVKDATIVLKRAKASGQGRVGHYTQALAAETRERTRILDMLRSALKVGNELFLAYQPQIDLATGRVVGLEALARWRTPSGELISPDRFIPVAEHSGLILQMGQLGLLSALSALRQIHAAGNPGIRMAVNVSASQFRHKGLLARIEAILAETGIAPDCLELEITESIAIMGIDFVAEQMSALRSRGIALAIDDFGTGYSSLSYLHRLPVDRLKIDRAFVNALDSDSVGARIVDLVIPLGHRLNMKVLAEGAETESQVTALRELGCDEVQGYYFARPMTLEQLLPWLAARR